MFWKFKKECRETGKEKDLKKMILFHRSQFLCSFHFQTFFPLSLLHTRQLLLIFSSCLLPFSSVLSNIIPRPYNGVLNFGYSLFKIVPIYPLKFFSGSFTIIIFFKLVTSYLSAVLKSRSANSNI